MVASAAGLPAKAKVVVAISAGLIVIATILGIIAATGTFAPSKGVGRPVPKLFFREHVGSPPLGKLANDARPDINALVLQGFGGSSIDYVGFASYLATEGANLTGLNWHVVSVDLRHHGKTRLGYKADKLAATLGPYPWAGGPDIKSAAADVANFIRESGMMPDLVIGHSMGCKTAMEVMRLLQQDGPLGSAVPGGREMQFWLLEGRLGIYNFPGIDDPKGAAKAMTELYEVPVPVRSKQEYHDSFMSTFLHQSFEPAAIEFLADTYTPALIPVVGEQGLLELNFDTYGACKMLTDLFFQQNSTDIWKSLPQGVSVHIVKGNDSFVLLGAEDEIKLALTNPEVHYYVMPNAGHSDPIFHPDWTFNFLGPQLAKYNAQQG